MSGKDFSVDLQDMFEQYAWKRFNSERNVFQRLIQRRSKYYIDVRWGYLEFKHKTERFDVRPDAISATPEDVSVATTGNSGTSPKVSKDVILYKSDYENKTPLDQEYSFQTTRETTTSTSVEFQESYTKGAECNIEISVPGDIVTVGAGLSGELSVTKTEGETFEETRSWTVDTKINVKTGHRAEASVHVSERNSVADFEVKTTMSIVKGKDLPIAVRRLEDDKIESVVIVPDLKDVFYKIADVNPNVEFLEDPDRTRKPARMRHSVILHSHGVCKSTSWKSQHVEVQSERIPGYTPAEDATDNCQDGQ